MIPTFAGDSPGWIIDNNEQIRLVPSALSRTPFWSFREADLTEFPLHGISTPTACRDVYEHSFGNTLY